MKKAVSLLLAIALLLALPAGCAKKEENAPKTTAYTAEELAAALIASQSEPPEFYYVTQSDSVFAAYAVLYLGADLARSVKSGAICWPEGPLASETAVFELDSAENAEKAPEPMSGYIDNRVAAFFGYAPEESELASAGRVRVLGNYAVLYILADADAANKALDAAFSDEAPAPPDLAAYASPLHESRESEGEPGAEPDGTDKPDEPDEPDKPDEPDEPDEPDKPNEPNEPDEHNEPDEPSGPDDPATTPGLPDESDEYDHDQVLSALRGETDPAGLSPKNLAVYDTVTDVLNRLLKPDMSDYDKELAVNDYLVACARYDPAELHSGPVGTPDPDNDNPYGVLVHGKGICLGYASTFQLFMDLLNIECLTVRGYANAGDDHAWNLVRLDGAWYAVDVTWNDPVFSWTPNQDESLYYAHRYFNVTSDYLRMTGHTWDEDVPEAEGTKWAYQ